RAARRSDDTGGRSKKEYRRIRASAQAARPSHETLWGGHGDHIEHGKAENEQEVPDREPGPRTGAHGAEERSRKPGDEAENRVEQCEAGHVREGESCGPGAGLLAHGRTREDA